MDIDLYCKIYLKTSLKQDELKALLSGALAGSFDGRAISANILLMDLFINKEAMDGSNSDRAVDWPFYLEVEPIECETCQPESFVTSIATLLKALRASGIQATPSCDFEEQLAD
jgi:hypothetical protein